MKELHQTITINAPVHKVWEALVEPKIIEEWGAGPATMTDKEEAEFSLWGGDIHGKNTQVENNHILGQEWFAGKWDQPSLVTFTLITKEETTAVDLVQTQIPDDEFNDIEKGWQDYYLGAIKKLLEEREK